MKLTATFFSLLIPTLVFHVLRSIFQTTFSCYSLPLIINTLFISTLLLTISLNYWLVPGGFAWRDYKQSTKLIGPMGWPILGTLPQMGFSAHTKLASLATCLKAKKLMALSLGATRVVISSHPETTREILFGQSFSDRPIKESARSLMFERAIGFAPSGSYWRKLRRIAAFHMFSPRRILGLESLRQRVADEMVVRVWKEMEENGAVEIRGILQEGSFSNILESVFGNCLSLGGSEELGNMVKEGYELIAMFNLEDYFPLKFLDFYGVKRRCHKLAAKVSSIVGQIVEERKRAQELFVEDYDFLSTLLSLPNEERLGDSDMVAILWVSFFFKYN